MTYSKKYIGGEYASHELLPFTKDGATADIFQKEINGKKIHYFETGADALAAIVIQRCESQKRLNFFVPENYCLETLERLQMKLRKQNIEIFIIRYKYTSEITLTGFSCIILNHYNLYKPFDRYFFGRTCFTIEDFVQAPFDIKSFRADYAINSLRKFCNIEVSVAYMDNNPALSENSVSKYYEYKKEAEKLKTLFFETGNETLEPAYLSLYQKANESLLNDEICDASASEISKCASIDFETILKHRRANFNYLKKRLTGIRQVQVLDGDYMYLMIDCELRDELKRYLAQRGIFTAIHWLDSKSDIVNKRLSLHIDHRYNFNDLDKVYKAIELFYAK